MSIGVAIMFVIVMCPFCTLHKTMLLTAHNQMAQKIVAGFITGVHVQTSLLTIDVMPMCGTDIGMLWKRASKLVRLVCVGSGNSLWGKHLVFDANSHVCNLEEQIRAAGGGLLRSIGGDVGCIHMNIAKLVSVVSFSLLFAAVTFHILAAVHTQIYYSIDHSKRRRCIAMAFWGLGPGCATCAAALYYALVNPQRMVLQGLFKPPPGEPYPIDWGTAWWAMTLMLSYGNCIGVTCFMDHLMPEDTMHKYAEYEKLSATQDAYYATLAVENAASYGAVDRGFVEEGKLAPSPYGGPRF